MAFLTMWDADASLGGRTVLDGVAPPDMVLPLSMFYSGIRSTRRKSP